MTLPTDEEKDNSGGDIEWRKVCGGELKEILEKHRLSVEAHHKEGNRAHLVGVHLKSGEEIDEIEKEIEQLPDDPPEVGMKERDILWYPIRDAVKGTEHPQHLSFSM